MEYFLIGIACFVVGYILGLYAYRPRCEKCGGKTQKKWVVSYGEECEYFVCPKCD